MSQVFYAKIDTNNIVTMSGFAEVSDVSGYLSFAQAVEITQSQFNTINAGGTFTLVGATLTNVTPAPTIASLQASACASIDMQAEKARLQYVTGGAVQQIVYSQKKVEADQFLVAYPSATAAASATASSWPFLNAEVGITGATLFDVATTIEATANAWIAVAAQIENLRLTSKAAINAATTQSAITTASQVTWPKP